MAADQFLMKTIKIYSKVNKQRFINRDSNFSIYRVKKGFPI